MAGNIKIGVKKGQNDGVASLDGSGKVPTSQLPDAVVGALNYKGSWNASTNSPTLSGSGGGGDQGDYYVVSTAGSTSLDGISDWEINDWVVNNGSAWEKIDNTQAAHALGGSLHTTDTLANLNSKITDATLDDSNDTRDPNAHTLGGSAHSSDTLSNLNAKISDATLDDSSDTRDPNAHALGGSAHSADTLANLNTKVSDATLDDSGDSRPPTSHGDAAHSGTIGSASQIDDFDTEVANNTTVASNTSHRNTTTGNPHAVDYSDLSSGNTAGGDLSGTYPNPTVDNDSHSHGVSTLTGITSAGSGAIITSGERTDIGNNKTHAAGDGSDHADVASNTASRHGRDHGIASTADHNSATLAAFNNMISDATLDDSGDSRPPTSHSIASHSDTTATGSELNTLTGGGNADSLHSHSPAAESWDIKDGSYTASAGDNLIVGDGVTITLPSSPSADDKIRIAVGGDWSSNNATIARNGKNIMGEAENLTLDVNSGFDLVYKDATWGWSVA